MSGQVVYIARCPEHGLHGERDRCFVCDGPVEKVAMVPLEGASDPRQLGGEMAGPGGPYDHGQVLIDTSRAILVDEQEIAKIDNPSDGREFAAVLVQGRINHSTDRAKVMLLGDFDMLAALITEAHGLAKRAGWQDELHRLCRERWERMP